MKPKKSYPKILLGVFTIIWIILAITPKYRDVWIVENILSVLLIITLIITYHKFQFSNLSYSLIFIFLILHSIGAHYSYSEMPLFDLLKNWLNLSRNHYDRVVHFLFGLVFYFPLQEFISRKLKIKKLWSHFFTFMILVGLKGVYEILEVGYHLVAESNVVETNFLGMQDDRWDAQKDMFLGMIAAGFGWLFSWFRK